MEKEFQKLICDANEAVESGINGKDEEVKSLFIVQQKRCHVGTHDSTKGWIPACAGMTPKGQCESMI